MLRIPLNETKLNKPEFNLACEGVNQIPQSPKIFREEVKKQVFIREARGKHTNMPTMYGASSAKQLTHSPGSF